MSRADIALEKSAAGYNCSQSVLYPFCEELGIDLDTALRMACGFGGGMGRRQEVCGALSGGVLAIGLKHGRGTQGDRTQTDETYVKVRELFARFEAQHGATTCRALLGCDLRTAEGMQHAKEQGLFDSICKACIRTAVEAVEEIL